MRVLFYVSDNQWSGTSRATLDAARGLAARNNPITIACCADSRLEREARAFDIETIPIDSAANAVSGALDLQRVLVEKFVEVVVVDSERDHLIVSSALRFAERGAVLRRLASSCTFTIGASGKLALRLASSGLVVPTERDLPSNLPLGWTIPTQVVPIGVDTSKTDGIEPATWHEMRVPPSAAVIACSYDQSGRYRLGVALRAMALLARRHANIHFVVFGPGSADDDLRMHAAALGVTQIVTLLGEVDNEQRIMRAAQAGWVVSGSDTGAFACLDFMALRVPVIAERSPLTQHYVADGITGILLSSADATYTASKVTAFLMDSERRLAMGNAGRARTQREFSYEAMIDGYERAANAAGDRTKWTTR